MEQTASFSDNTLEYICGICTFKSSDQKTLVKHITGHIDNSREHEHHLWCALCRPFSYLHARSDGESSDTPSDSGYSGNSSTEGSANGDPSYYAPGMNPFYFTPMYNTNQVYHTYFVNDVCYFRRYSENEFYDSDTLTYPNQNPFSPYVENGSNILNPPLIFDESSTANSLSYNSVNGGHLQQTTPARHRVIRDALPYTTHPETINSELHRFKDESYEPHTNAIYAESFSENISSDKLCLEAISKSPCMEIISTDVICQKDAKSKSERLEDKSVETSPKISNPEYALKDITPAKAYPEMTTIKQIRKDAGNVRPPSKYANAESSPHAVNSVEPLLVASNSKCPHQKEKYAKAYPEMTTIKQISKDAGNVRPPSKYANAESSPHAVNSVEPLLVASNSKCPHQKEKYAEPVLETCKAKSSHTALNSAKPLPETCSAKYPRSAIVPTESLGSKAKCSLQTVKSVEPLKETFEAKCLPPAVKSAEPLLETSETKCPCPVKSAKSLPKTRKPKCRHPAVKSAESLVETSNASKAKCRHPAVKSSEPLVETSIDKCSLPAVKPAEPLLETSETKIPSPVKPGKPLLETRKAKRSRPPVKSVELLPETSNDKCPQPTVKSVEHFSETLHAESLHRTVKCVEFNPETSKSKSPCPVVKNVKPLPEVLNAKLSSLDISAVNPASDATSANLVKTVKSFFETTNAKSPLADKTVKSLPETATARCSNVIAKENFQQTVHEFPSQKVKSIEQIPETTRAKSVPLHVTTIVPIPQTNQFESSRLDCSVNRSPEKIKTEFPLSNVKPDERIAEINIESPNLAAEARKTLSETANAKFSTNLKSLPTSANDESSHKDITVNPDVRVVNSLNVDETKTTKLRPVSANQIASNDMLNDDYLHGNIRKNIAVSTKNLSLPLDAYRHQNEKISMKENKKTKYQCKNQSFCARDNLISNSNESHPKNLANRNDSSALRQGSKGKLSYSEVLKIGLSV